MAIKVINKNATPEYMAFVDAKRRCEQPSRPQYPLYGGRGIKFLFSDFDEFYNVLGEKPAKHSLDRIDNNGNYCPENVKWSTQSEQNSNRRTELLNKWKAKKYLIKTPEGEIIEILNMSEFCKKHGLVKSNLHVTLKSNGKHKGYQAMKYTPEVVSAYQASQVQPA